MEDRKIKKMPRVAGKIVLGAVLIVVTFLVVGELAIIGGVAWLHGAAGQEWLREQAASALSESEYKVDFDALAYSFPKGVSVRNLKVSDSGGVFADADRVTVRPDFLPLAAHRLSLAISAGTINLMRIPKGSGEEEGGSNGLQIPDMYFTTFIISDFKVKSFAMPESVSGVPMNLSPDLKARISLGEKIDMSLSGTVGQNGEEQYPWLPQDILIAGQLNPATLLMDTQSIQAKAQIYDLSGKGMIDLADSTMDLSVSGSVSGLDVYAQELKGGAVVDATLRGDIGNPSLDGLIKPDFDIADRYGLDVSSVKVGMKDLAETITGHMDADLAYKGRDIKAASDFMLELPAVSFSDINVAASDLEAAGNLTINTDSAIVAGNISAAAENLSAYNDLTGIELGGRGTADITLMDKGGVQALSVDAAFSNLVYQGMSAQSLKITASLPTIDVLWPEKATLKGEGLQVSEAVSMSSISVDAGRQESGSYKVSVDAAGRAVNPFTLKGSAFVDAFTQPLPVVSKIDLRVVTSDSVLALSGGLSSEAVDLLLKTDSFALAALPAELPASLQGLTMSGQATLTGAPSDPRGAFGLSFGPLRVSGADVSLKTDGTYDGQKITANITGTGTGIETLSGAVALPFKLSLSPFIASVPDGAALSGGLAVEADAAPLAAAFLPPGHKLSGAVNINAKIDGTVAQPSVTGTAEMSGGAYFNEAYDIDLRDLSLSAQISGEYLEIASVSARDKESGTLSGSGRIGISDLADTRLNLLIDNFHLLASEQVDGYISADLDLKPDKDGLLLQGTIEPRPVHINIPERFRQNIPTLNIVKVRDEPGSDPLFDKVRLALDVDAPNQVFVRGWGLDAEFGGSLDVTGTLDDPQLNGTLKSTRGRYEEFGRRFTLDKAVLRFEGRTPPSPHLDVKATTDAEDITASVMLTGPLDKPSIGFSSVPGLPEDEILSRILFGENMSNITPFQALQLKQTLDRFTGNGGNAFDPLGTVRKLTGLDDIRVDTDAEGEASVGVGKYLTDKVYLELEKGAGEEGGGNANLQIEVTPNINVESKLGTDTGAGAYWTWDY